MKNIRNYFVNEVITNFMSLEYDMPYIPFVFDDKTLQELYSYLNSNDELAYERGKKYLDYLKKIKNKQTEGLDGIYVPVHNANEFFNLLQELANLYPKDSKAELTYVWLRMGIDDIQNVEYFLKKQISFQKNNYVFESYKEILSLKEHRVLAYHIDTNKEYYEADRHITFMIRDSSKDIFDIPNDYEFPGIYFGLTKEKNKPICYIYSIQNINNLKDENIKKDLQPIRKQLRNKYVSSDFLIGLSLFLDFLYDYNIVDIVIPTLQVFNYAYHKQLSNSLSNSFNDYDETYKQQLEELYKQGDRSDKVLDYIYTKKQVDRFVDKEDLISHNKTERLIHMFYELQQFFHSFDIICTPFIEGENLIIKLHGKSNVLNNMNVPANKKTK